MAIPAYWPADGWSRGSDGTDVDLIAVDASKDTNYYLASLDPNGNEFLMLKAFIDKCLRDQPAKAPSREHTRMKRAEEWYGDQQKPQVVRDAAFRRMQEGRPGGPDPPQTKPITIRDIKVVRNIPLWEMYESFRDKLVNTLDPHGNVLTSVTWAARSRSTTPHVLNSLPVINPTIGEVMLFHGTTEQVSKFIVSTGFRPDMGANSGTPTNPRFGYSGQGTYFSDNFGKTMTYGSCKNCWDYECFCRDDAGRKYPRIAVMSRVLLGSIDQKYKLWSSEKKYRKQAFTDINPGKHSVYTKGIKESKNIFTFGGSNNEFLAKHAAQMYPEFLVYYVVGADNVASKIASKVAYALERYAAKTKFNQSKESRDAVNVLTNALARGSDTELLNLCMWYLGTKTTNRPQVATAALNAGSSLFVELDSALKAP